MSFFSRHWSTYHRVLAHDLMEHQALTAALADAIDRWLERRPAGAPAPHLVDLGCGDLALLPPLLRRLPLASFTGLDLNGAVLPLAAGALGPVPYPCRFLEGDLLAWAEAEPAADPAEPEPPVDLLLSCFAVHHLQAEEKGRFLEGCRRRLAPGGLLLWADVFRPAGESRDAYVARYSRRVNGWGPLEPERQAEVIDHLSQWDHPADREAIRQQAEVAGWQWRWAWQGSHDAEALALLSPATLPAAPLASGGGPHPHLLADRPVGGGFLRMPGLEQLLGDPSEGFRVSRGVDGAVEALDLEPLADGEFDGRAHDSFGRRMAPRYRPGSNQA